MSVTNQGDDPHIVSKVSSSSFYSESSDPLGVHRAVTDSDALLGCLVYLSKFYERPRTIESLRSGISDYDGHMTASQFVKAAPRANLTARVVRRSFKTLDERLFPIVLITRDETALILQGSAPDGGFLVLDPLEGSLPQEMSSQDLQARYAGYAILVRPPLRSQHHNEADANHKSWFWGPVGKSMWLYAQVIVAAIVVNFFQLASPLFIMAVYDRVLPNQALDTLWVLAIGVFTVYAFDFIIRSLRSYFVDVAGARVDIIAQKRIFSRLIDVKLSDVKESPGEMSNTIREFEQLREFLTSATLTTLVDVPFTVLFIVALYIIAGPVAWVLVTVVIVVLVVGLAIQIPLHRLTQQAFKTNETKHSVLVESVSALETVKQVGAQGRLRKQWDNALSDSADTGRRARTLSQIGVNFTQTCHHLAIVGVVVVGVLAVQSGQMTAGAMMACVMLTGRTLAPLAQMAQLASRFNRAIAAFASLKRIMNYETESGGRDFLAKKSFDGEIELRNVSFKYPGSAKGTLHDITCHVKPGEIVGVVGRVGSGKSTFLKLLMGLYEPDEGSVLFDGIDGRQLDPADMRAAVGCAPQEPILFRGTVRDNIATSQPWADEEAILEASRVAGVHDFIAQHPLGYELVVGDRGQGLSGGQRQAVALARALMTDPPILILDEPSSSMDNTTEAQLTEHLKEVLKGRTVFLVTHRLSLLQLVDRIMVLDQGRIVRDGPRQEVIAALGGTA